jgi:hypothetical protein
LEWIVKYEDLGKIPFNIFIRFIIQLWQMSGLIDQKIICKNILYQKTTIGYPPHFMKINQLIAENGLTGVFRNEKEG